MAVVPGTRMRFSTPLDIVTHGVRDLFAQMVLYRVADAVPGESLVDPQVDQLPCDMTERSRQTVRIGQGRKQTTVGRDARGVLQEPID